VKNLGWFLGVLLIASCEFPRPADVGPKDGAPDDAGNADAPTSVSTNCQLTGIEPTIANTGDTLTIEGTFVDAVTVNFPGGTSAAATVLGPHRATVIVPASATAGDLTITTCGSTVGPLRFRRASFPLGVGMFAANLDQASGARQMTKLVTARDSHAATVVGGHLYVVGGVGSGGSLNSVEAAMINADGSLGPFEVVADVTLATARQAHTTVVIGNRLYAVGGFGSASLGSVEQATISPDGKLGTFATVAGVALTTARQGHTSAVIGNYVYVFGGFGGSALNSVERATINADGSLEPFVTVSGVSLATARYGHTSTVVGNKLYVIGGTGSSGVLGDVEQATINADGSIGPFEAAAGVALSTARTGHSTVALGMALYIVGGVGASGSLANVEQMTINGDGSLEMVAAAAGVILTTARHGHSAVVVGNYIYLLGGTGSGLLSSVERATINDSGELEPLTTAPDVTFESLRTNSTAVVIGDYLYSIGADTNGVTVERAVINSDGSLQQFMATPGVFLTTARTGHTTAIVGHYLYVIGGVSGGVTLDNLERATINADGSLGSFEVVSGANLRMARSTHTSVVIGDYLYVLGGATDQGLIGSVERAVTNPDGSLGLFTFASSALVAARQYHNTIISGSYIYVLGGGGVTVSDGTRIERSVIGTDGTIGPFTTVANITLSARRIAPTTVVIGSHVNVLGGSSFSDTSKVEQAAINPDGSLGPFATHPDSSLTIIRFYNSAVMTGNYLYLLGGIFGGLADGSGRSIDWLQLK